MRPSNKSRGNRDCASRVHRAEYVSVSIQAEGTMATEKREFSRIPIPLDQSGTLLRVGDEEFNVHLIDASPVGFALTCPKGLNVKIGDIYRVRTSEGWLEARVVRIGPLPNGEEYPAEYDCLVRLERLRDLDNEPDYDLPAAMTGRRAVLLLSAGVVLGLFLGGLLHFWAASR